MGVGIGGYKLCLLCHHKKMYHSTPKDERCGTKQREAKGLVCLGPNLRLGPRHTSQHYSTTSVKKKNMLYRIGQEWTTQHHLVPYSKNEKSRQVQESKPKPRS